MKVYRKYLRNKLIPAAILLLLTAFLFSMCAKEQPYVPLKTRLLITVSDEDTLSVDSTIVRLYKVGVDTPIIIQTDASGKAYYEDLDSALYYWYANKGCRNNYNSTISLNKELKGGLILYGTTTIGGRSVVKVINKATDTLQLFDSSFTAFNIRPDTTVFVYPKLGSRKLRTVNIRTKDTAYKQVSVPCNDTLILGLPF